MATSEAAPGARGPRDRAEPGDRTVFELDLGGAFPNSLAPGSDRPTRPPLRRQVPDLDAQAPRGDREREFEPAHQRTLRLALAMRGGVSLAVWIGGAVAEIDLWRRLRIRRRTSDGTVVALYIPPGADDAELDEDVYHRVLMYARLLDSAQFDSVEVDVQAGASAGGLNAVMYACAQRAGADVDQLLDTWVDVGGIWSLMQRPGFHSVSSVLRGDTYFFPKVLGALHDFYAGPRNPLHRADRLTVDLSATVADSEDAVDRGTKEGRGHFHFVASPDQPSVRERGRAIPAPGSATRDADLARLALAARTTSSFPGAFEPALIFSRETGQRESKIRGGDDSVDMTYAFHAHRTGWAHPFRVVDGGVLDNIPIDRAFRAIRNTASEVNTSRAMLYLDPDPPAQPLRSVRALRYGPITQDEPRGPRSLMVRRYTDRQSTFFAAISAGRGKRGISESGADEEDAIEQYRLDLLLDRARTQALTPMSTMRPGRYPQAAARSAYLQYRASSDPQVLSAVLINPSLWQLSTNLPTREVWRGWNEEERSALPDCFARGYQRLESPASLFPPAGSASHDTPQEGARAILIGPQALLDAARSGLAWVRSLEELTGALNEAPLRRQRLDRLSKGDPLRSLAALRRRLYSVLSAAVDARDRCFRAALTAADQVRGTATESRRSLDRAAEHLRDGWLAASVAEAPLLRARWSDLDDAVAALRVLSGARKKGAAAVEWSRQPWSGVPQRYSGFTAVDLAPFAAAMGIPEAVPQLTYWKITADERPAHPERYGTLHSRRLRLATSAALTLRKEDLDREVTAMLFSDQSLTADDKLAGTSLFHFAGFLSEAWRANDWWWGRLDAAAGMIRFISSMIPPATEETPSPGSDRTRIRPEPRVAYAQDSVLCQAANATKVRPFRTSLPTNPSPDRIREAFTLGADTMADMRPGYVFAVLSRGIRVTSRALAGSLGFWERAIIVLLRPLLLFAAVVLNPLREALIAAVLGVSIALIGGTLVATGSGPDGAAITVGLALVVVGALLLLRGVVRPIRSWRRVSGAVGDLEDMPDEARREFAKYRRSALTQGWAYAVASLVTLGIAAGALVVVPHLELWRASWNHGRAGMSVSFWILLVSGIVLAFRAGVRFHAPNESPHRKALYWWGFVIYLAWIVLVLELPWLHPGAAAPEQSVPVDIRDAGLPVAVMIGAAGVAVALLLTWGWLGFRGGWRPLLINSITVSLLAGAGAFLSSWLLIDSGLTHAGTLVATLVIVLVTLFVWGTLLWWIPEIPEGRSPTWRIPGAGSELRKGIADQATAD
ncbi:DUF3376 domain-containing protein [Leifsonia sp. NPDC080035]|uniref:DUF3376 domain-containing protein n=1 Tax=Leifsonia sp. NPDC080035 TaxID=3143936 RepID=A0AAU7G9S5_9MICO